METDQMLLSETIKKKAKEMCGQVALIEGERKLGYDRLDLLSDRVVHTLLKRGFQPGDVIAVCMPRGIDFVVLMLGLLKGGFLALPVDLQFPLELRSDLLDHLNPKLIIEDIPSAKDLEHCERIAPSELWSSSDTCNLVHPESSMDSPVLILLTSGSTGLPQGVLRTQRCLSVTLQEANKIKFSEEKQATSLMRSPISSSGIVWELFYALALGFKIVIAPDKVNRNALALVKLISEYKIQNLACSPAGLESLMNIPDFFECNFIKMVNCNGATLSVESRDRFLRAFPNKLSLTYGCTEAPGITTLLVTLEDSNERLLGKVHSSYQYRIVGKDKKPVDVGEPGILAVAGPRVTIGYVNNDNLNKQRFHREEDGTLFFLTGDVVVEDEHGVLVFHGRRDRIVQVRGFRVDLSALESTLTEHHAVREAAVSLEKKKDKNTIIAYVALNKKKPELIRQIREEIHVKLPAYSLPSRIILLDSLPRTLNGKIDYKVLPDPDRERSDWELEPKRPKTKTEKRLVCFWEKLLDFSPVGIEDHFFLSGGDSLMVLQLIERCNKEFNISLNYEMVYQLPKLVDLASYIDQLIDDKSFSLYQTKNLNGKSSVIVWVQGLNIKHSIWENISSDHPIFLFQYQGLGEDGKVVIWKTVQEIAENLVRILLRNNSNGPYILGGYCAGAVIALEMARILMEKGCDVRLLVINEPASTLGRLTVKKTLSKANVSHQNESKYSKHTKKLNSLSLIDKIKYVSSKAMFKHRIVIIARRYLFWQSCFLGKSISSETRYQYIVDHVYTPAFQQYSLKPLDLDILLFYNEHGGHYVEHEWSGLSKKSLTVKKIKNAGHVDSLKSPYIEKWFKYLQEACEYKKS